MPKKKVKKEKGFSLGVIAFLQAAGLVIYCFGVGFLIWRADRWVGPPYTFLGPTLFLVLFVASALISALLILGYPFHLFWIQKKQPQAFKLVFLTTGWLAFLVTFFLLLLIAF